MRASTDGVLEALVQTVLLLVAVRYFATSDLLRSLIAMSRYMGFICSLFYIALVSRSRYRITSLATLPTLASGLVFIAAARANTPQTYAILASIAVMTISVRQPFFTRIYEENYPLDKRARLYSVGVIVSVVFAC